MPGVAKCRLSLKISSRVLSASAGNRWQSRAGGDCGMRHLRLGLVIGILLTAGGPVGQAQPADIKLPPPGPAPEPVLPSPDEVPAAPLSAAGPTLQVCLSEIEDLREEEAALQKGAQDDEQKKRVDLLQKQ